MIADEVLPRLLARVDIPDDLARLIYYILAQSPEPKDRDKAIIEHVVSLHRIISRLPTGTVFPSKIGTHVSTYPYTKLAEYPWSFDPPYFDRHAHVVAQTGAGKTQLLQRLIYRDLETNAGVCVIAPKGSMVRNLARLAIVDLKRLVVFHPFLPIGLNLLKLFGENPRESEENHIVELVNFAFGSLASAETTAKQTVLVSHCVRLLIRVPGASLLTLRKLIQQETCDYPLDRVHPLVRDFFETQFSNKSYRETKEQLVWRLDKLFTNSRIYRMLSSPRCDFPLDLFRNVVLIDTSTKHMGEDGSTFLGRCFIHLLSIFATTRDDYQPVYCYVDECSTYLTSSVNTLLERAREARVGLILAHQQLSQLSPDLEASLLTNTAVKFVGKVSAGDAHKLGREIMVEPLTLQTQRPLHFYMNRTPVEVPLAFVENQPTRAPQEVMRAITQQYLRLSYTPPTEEHTDIWSDL